MERRMEMNEKYIMQSSKWHAAAQTGSDPVVEELGTIYCLQHKNQELTLSGQVPTLQCPCWLPPAVAAAEKHECGRFPAILFPEPDPTCTNLCVDLTRVVAELHMADEAFCSRRFPGGQVMVPLPYQSRSFSSSSSAAFFPVSHSETWTNLGISWCVGGHTPIILYEHHLHHRLLPQSLEPVRKTLVGYWECLGCLHCGIGLSRIIYTDLWDTSYR